MRTVGRILLALTLSSLTMTLSAQTTKYTTFIYSNPTLSDEIVQKYAATAREGSGGSSEMSLGAELGSAALSAAKGIMSGYVGSAFDLGVTAVAGLITREQRLKNEWKQMIDAENRFETHIASVNEMSDFYASTSTNGALDPTGMIFDGFGCLRKEGDDTVFFISCHVDRQRIDRIVNHSKFQLVLDTLIISPFRSNLPNSNFDTTFDFSQRTGFVLSVNMELTASWIDQLPQIHKDEQLGAFNISIPVGQASLDSTGFLRYSRESGKESKFKVMGESFIVPRSYTGVRDGRSGRMIYGTGEYRFSVDIVETCSVTQKYAKNWKQNRRQRRKAAKNGNLVENAWRTITSQSWDNLTEQWVITVLQAPADILKEDAIEGLGLHDSK